MLQQGPLYISLSPLHLRSFPTVNPGFSPHSTHILPRVFVHVFSQTTAKYKRLEGVCSVFTSELNKKRLLVTD
jgi:hypothetical protein